MQHIETNNIINKINNKLNINKKLNTNNKLIIIIILLIINNRSFYEFIYTP